MALNLESVGTKLGPFEQRYDWKDVALYALAVGAGDQDLSYLLDDPAPRVLPTWAVIPAFEPVFAAIDATGGNKLTLVHSAQRTELLREFPASGVMQTRAEVAGIWDMKVGALLAVDTETEVDGVLTARTRWQLLLRGEGGFKGPRPPSQFKAKPPKGQDPDFEISVPTARTQALLYRLTGDINPIHAMPDVAAEAGFERPILHGLCSYGIAGREALKFYAGDDPGRFRSLEARFTKPVIPGETLIVRGYRVDDSEDGAGRAVLTVTVEESGAQAIAGALLEFVKI